MQTTVIKSAAFVIVLLHLHLLLPAQSSGETIFKSTCAACHTIDQGKLVGPELSRVYEQREQQWLIDFIRSSQKMVKAGDSIAVALYKEYNQVPMPDNNLSDNEILSILDYIREADGGSSAAAMEQQQSGTGDSATVRAAGTDTLQTAGNDTLQTAGTDSIQAAGTATVQAAGADTVFTKDQAMLGFALFYGKEKFSNGPVSCFGCHQIRDESSMIGGGQLSLDLTGSYTRLGPAGIRAMLSNPPFPVMKSALVGKELAEEEIEALTAMLQYADKQFSKRPGKTTGTTMFIILGLTLAMFILIHLYLIYDNRKIPS